MSSGSSSLAPVTTCPIVLRALFNEHQFYERVLNGSLKARITSQKSAPASLGEPAGTVSEMVAYIQEGIGRVALVHQYRRPDGSIAASGMPDPKWLRVGADVMIPHLDRVICPECAPRTSYAS